MKNTITIHFARSNDITGKLIRFFTFSHWNHIAIEIDGIIYEARLNGGVASMKATQWNWHGSDSVEVPVTDKEKAKSFLKDQIGKKYDWTALVALPFREGWEVSDKWFCSELAVEALVEGGHDYLDDILPSYRVTPKDAMIISKVIASADQTEVL